MPRRLQVDVYNILDVLNATDSTNVSDSDQRVQEVTADADSAANKVFNNEVLMTLLSDLVDVANVGNQQSHKVGFGIFGNLRITVG